MIKTQQICKRWKYNYELINYLWNYIDYIKKTNKKNQNTNNSVYLYN